MAELGEPLRKINVEPAKAPSKPAPAQPKREKTKEPAKTG